VQQGSAPLGVSLYTPVRQGSAPLVVSLYTPVQQGSTPLGVSLYTPVRQGCTPLEVNLYTPVQNLGRLWLVLFCCMMWHTDCNHTVFNLVGTYYDDVLVVRDEDYLEVMGITALSQAEYEALPKHTPLL